MAVNMAVKAVNPNSPVNMADKAIDCGQLKRKAGSDDAYLADSHAKIQAVFRPRRPINFVIGNDNQKEQSEPMDGCSYSDDDDMDSEEDEYPVEPFKIKSFHYVTTYCNTKDDEALKDLVATLFDPELESEKYKIALRDVTLVVKHMKESNKAEYGLNRYLGVEFTLVVEFNEEDGQLLSMSPHYKSK